MAAIGKKYWTGCLASEKKQTPLAAEFTAAASATSGAHKPPLFPPGESGGGGGK